MSLMAKIAVGGVRFYQAVVSPHLGMRCRFLPSCSEYTTEALAVHGFFKGSWLGFKRVLRCHPFGKSGLDPVPQKENAVSVPVSRRDGKNGEKSHA